MRHLGPMGQRLKGPYTISVPPHPSPCCARPLTRLPRVPCGPVGMFPPFLDRPYCASRNNLGVPPGYNCPPFRSKNNKGAILVLLCVGVAISFASRSLFLEYRQRWAWVSFHARVACWLFCFFPVFPLVRKLLL